MRGSKKYLSILLAASLISSLGAGSALAEDREKVGKITLNFTSSIEIGDSGGEVDVSTTTDHVYVDSVEVVNDDGEKWTRARTPVIEVVLVADDDYYFSSSSKSSFRLKLTDDDYDDVEFRDASREDDNTTLILTVRLTDEDTEVEVPEPDNAYWESTYNGYGQWDEVSSAQYYQLQLLLGSDVVGSMINCYDTSYDFSGMITQAGSYRFRVRTVEYGSGDKSDWETSGTWTVDAQMASQFAASAPATSSPASSSGSGSWQKAADNVRWWWRNPDGSYPASQWMQIGGVWYYFDAQGYMCTGWLQLGDVYYYLDPSTGAMAANCRTPDGYWVNEQGAWVPGA